MGEVIGLFHGRRRPGKIPKPTLCCECDEPIETARLQVLDTHFPRPFSTMRKCIACARAGEAREKRILAMTGEDDIVIIRR